jgi:ketosteroid isomerase-like protein
MGGQQFGTNTYELVKQELNNAKRDCCLASSYVLIGMRRRGRPAVWLIGENHEAPRRTRCKSVEGILSKITSCDPTSEKRVSMFVEIHESVLDVHFRQSSRNFYRDPSLHFVWRAIEFWMRKDSRCHNVIHCADDTYFVRGTEPTSQTLFEYVELANLTLEFLQETFEVQVDPSDDDLDDVRRCCDNAIRSAYFNRHPRLVNRAIEMMEYTHSVQMRGQVAAINEFEEAMNSDDVDVQRKGEGKYLTRLSSFHLDYVSIVGDAMTIQKMLDDELSNLQLCYWGLKHTWNQMRMLQAYGYEIFDSVGHTFFEDRFSREPDFIWP